MSPLTRAGLVGHGEILLDVGIFVLIGFGAVSLHQDYGLPHWLSLGMALSVALGHGLRWAAIMTSLDGVRDAHSPRAGVE